MFCGILKLELRGPGIGRGIDPHSSGGARSASFPARMPNLVTKEAGGRAGGAFWGVRGGGAPQEDL
eukprot:6266154-Alexandrium_andersonii.AAC.1